MSSVQYEVEQKFPVADSAALEARLAELEASDLKSRDEVDVYYAHPARDFGSTDEALRIRRIGREAWIAYKGPKIDPTTKTRRELELPLSAHQQAAPGWEDLLETLGFTPVGEVRKRRRRTTVRWEGREVLVSLDDVDQLGSFVELEICAAEDDIEPAKACIVSLAAKLGLSGGERRSYLELVLQKRSR
jgi:adenylate cyclase class 2